MRLSDDLKAAIRQFAANEPPQDAEPMVWFRQWAAIELAVMRSGLPIATSDVMALADRYRRRFLPAAASEEEA